MTLIKSISVLALFFVSTHVLAQEADDDEKYGSIYDKECTELMLGAHGCKPQTGAKGVANNLLSLKLGTKGCAAGNEVFEYPAGSKKYICYHLPSREAWNVVYGKKLKGYDIRHPNAPIPTEDEKNDCLKWGRPIQRKYDGCD